MSTRFYVVREISVAAGGVERIPVEGYWLTVLEASGVFSLGFDNSDPQPGIEAGLAIPAGKWGYNQVVIENKSAVELTATLAFNDDGVRDNRLVLSGGGVDVNNFPAGFDVNNFPATFGDGLTEQERFGQVQVGASSTVLHNGPAGSATLIDATANTGGCVVRTLWAQNSASQHTLSIHTAPLTALGQGKPLSSAYNAAAVPFYHPPNLFIPAGQGLYFYAATTGNSAAVTFDLL